MGKVIGTRYPLDVQEALDKMPSDDRQQLIRDAVENALIRKGLLSNDISPS